MTDTPTKQTLDTMERIGREFSSEFLSIKSMLRQSIDRTIMYIITDRTVASDGSVSYTWNPNMTVLYTEEEKKLTIDYYESLITCYNIFCAQETNSLGTIYDLFNATPRLDKVVGLLANEGLT